ncbi:putative TetR family transcriptional regulator [Ilumatobacter coccineus YM16-304]|uniref:Putative TetR family transcriptional regulator n=2 Tax=Ilumatobacter coccineus TaxID=467094 RepID=A0A6C7E8I0_ILUCY|nr:putative TetR family transcriptional regulator [Ilumatobacter coccineus YM16-304]
MTDGRFAGSRRMTASMSPRAARSRDKMLRAATELIVESGPRAVTVDAVAEASGVAKSTLYRHWSSRDEMLVDVVRCNVPQLTEPDLSVGFVDALSAFLASAAAALSDPEWSRIIPTLMSLRATMPELSAVVDADRSAKTETLSRILEVGVAEGAIPADLDPLDVEKLLFGPMFFAAILGEHDRVEGLAAAAAERFVASYA